MSLREFLPEDNAAWQRVAGDPLLIPHTPWPPVTTPDAAAAWLRETERRAALVPRLTYCLAVEQYGSDLVGAAILDVVSVPHLQGEISCFLRPDRWREGLGTEVARLLLELAFIRLGLHRVQAAVDPRNIGARGVLERVNMRHEGTFLDRYLIAGQWCDRAVYAITMPEWRGLPWRGTGPAVEAVPEPVAELTVPELVPKLPEPVPEPEAEPVPKPGPEAEPGPEPAPVAAEPEVPEPVEAPSPVPADTSSERALAATQPTMTRPDWPATPNHP